MKLQYSLGLFSVVLVIVLFFPCGSRASDETLTITTYYPSPYGVYNELTTHSNTNLAINSGNVGVGTTNPQVTMHIKGVSLIERDSSAFSINASPRLGLVDTYLDPVTVAPAWYIDNVRDRFRVFRQPNITTAGTTYLSINNTGGVATGSYAINASNPGDTLIVPNGIGIGTTNPAAALDVNGVIITKGGDYGPWTTGAHPRSWMGICDNIKCSASIPLDSVTGNYAFHMAGVTNSNYGIHGWGDTKRVIALFDDVLIPWGRLAIGTVTPSYTLTIAGTAGCTDGSWSGSDIRWKGNIQILSEDTLSKVLKLRGVSFDWKRKEFKENNFSEGRQIGIIAQEMEEVFPELVNTDDKGYKAIAYDKFTAVLLEAIKAQAERINVQQAQINNQQIQIDNLKAQVSR